MRVKSRLGSLFTIIRDNKRISMKKILAILMALMIATTGIISAEDGVIKIQTLEGKTIHIKGTENGFTIPEYKGKIVFAEFWGTQCPPCIISIPHYVELQAKYKDDLAILAVEVQDKPKDALKKFVKDKGMNYDVVSYREGMEFVEYVTQRAGWSGSIPFLLILDQKGVVQIVQPGLIPQEKLETVIKDLIAENKKKVAKK